MALFSGFIAALVMRVTKEEKTDFSDYKLISNDFGLYLKEETPEGNWNTKG